MLIKEENVPRMSWRKGRIIQFIKGNDGLIRGAQLQVFQQSKGKTTILKRPLQHLVPFEIADNRENNVLYDDSTDIRKNYEVDNNSTITNETPKRQKRMAATNADAKMKIINNDENEFSEEDELNE